MDRARRCDHRHHCAECELHSADESAGSGEQAGPAGEGVGVMAGQTTLEIPVTGMHCAACVGRVQQAIEGDGVSSAVVNLMTNSATVAFDPVVVKPEALVERIKATGYGASLPVSTQSDAER